MGNARPSNPVLWEKVRAEIQAADPSGSGSRWTPTKQDEATARYVEQGGQYESATDDAPEAAPGERIERSRAALPARNDELQVDFQDFMKEVEVEAEAEAADAMPVGRP